jgi:hypothetical protein
MLLTELNEKTFFLSGYDFSQGYASVVLTKNDRMFQVNFEEWAEDGYRSWLKTPVIERVVTNVAPQHVINREVRVVAYAPSDFTECSDEFRIYDIQTRQLLFEAYTDHNDAYYPIAIIRFHPIIEKKQKNK